jgi:hypothetical protein
MNRRLQLKLRAWILALFAFVPPYSWAWNIPDHMLSGAIAFQILQRESPSTIGTVRDTLAKHPWYENHWKAQLEKLSDTDRDEMLFMVAARWADDIRTKDRPRSHPQWHYINWPFKPAGEPDSIQVNPAQAETF